MLASAVGGTEDAGRREGQDECSAAIFQSVADQHRRNRRQAEKSKGIHRGPYPTGNAKNAIVIGLMRVEIEMGVRQGSVAYRGAEGNFLARRGVVPVHLL